MPTSLVTCENLVKIYKLADLEVMALQGLDLEVMPGEMLAIVGASGSGKTTLMNMLGALDTPSAGRCHVIGYDLTRLSEVERVRYRQSVVGHVWQQSGRNLLSELSAEANIALPQVLSGAGTRQRTQRAQDLLELVGLKAAARHKPDQLSGGEQQRLSIAVALANQPSLLLADEPTGELDSASARDIFALLRTLNQQLGLTVIIVTHDVDIAAAVDRTIAIRDGRTSTETVRRQIPLETESASGLGSSAIIGLPGETHQESILIDRVGRLQLPKEAFETIAFNGRALVRILSDHVELWPRNTVTDSQQREETTEEHPVEPPREQEKQEEAQ